MNSRRLTLTRNLRAKCPLGGSLLKSMCKCSCIQVGMAPFEETQIYESGIQGKKKNRYIGRNYSHYKRVICFTKGVTAGFLLNSSLKAFKTGSDLHSFSGMLLCKERHTCYGHRNSFAGLGFFFFFHPILLSLQRIFFQRRKWGYIDLFKQLLMFVHLNLNKIPVFFYADFSVSSLKNECVLRAEIFRSLVGRVIQSFFFSIISI